MGLSLLYLALAMLVCMVMAVLLGSLAVTLGEHGWQKRAEVAGVMSISAALLVLFFWLDLLLVGIT